MKIKRKGTYQYHLGWHQNHSALVVPKAAEAALVRGENIREFIEAHDNIFDFMLRAKIPRTGRLESEDYYGKRQVEQNLSRYMISMTGVDLFKIMPPLAGKDEERQFAINKGYKTTICNDIKDANPDDIEFEWYIREAHKLVDPLM